LRCLEGSPGDGSLEETGTTLSLFHRQKGDADGLAIGVLGVSTIKSKDEA